MSPETALLNALSGVYMLCIYGWERAYERLHACAQVEMRRLIHGFVSFVSYHAQAVCTATATEAASQAKSPPCTQDVLPFMPLCTTVPVSISAQIQISQGDLTQADKHNIRQRLQENMGAFLGLPGGLECEVLVSAL